MDEVTRDIQGGIPWCMLFADDVVLVDESRAGVNRKLELWRRTLESKGFRLSRTKTEYMMCDFSATRHEGEDVSLDGQVVVQKNTFRYLGSVLQKDGDINEDVRHRISAGWLKWRQASDIFCDKRVPQKLKGKFYRTAIRPAMRHVQQLSVAEMRMLRWFCGHTRRDRVRNEVIRDRVGVAPVRNGVLEQVDNVKRGKGRPKLTWDESVKRELKDWNISKEIDLDRSAWRLAINVPEL
ncbi:hypothetical protein PVAP13_2NG330109 [Panicum virgatum]|uniref:Reverse transcriptase domain-containing protein n=1 Tax=Panicum virgatum TaxID=38727 RepID=A0A8T0VTH2_PANVG|nr:hypothetical protein PVAP13_2NG330109 [Panicum virgatum]